MHTHTLATLFEDKRILNRLLLIICISLFAFLPQKALAQFTEGQIITIRSGTNNYLQATSSTAISNTTTLNLSCLWRVGGSSGAYTFENVQYAGSFLCASSNSSLTLASSGTSYTTFSLTNNSLLTSRSGSRYVRYNRGWGVSTTATTLTFTTFTAMAMPASPILIIDPDFYKYNSATTNTFTAKWTTSTGYKYTNGSTTIDATSTITENVTSEHSPSFTVGGDNRFALTSTSITTATAQATVRANTGATSGRLNVQATYNGRTYSTIAALYFNATFIHQRGMTERALIDNGSGKIMQGAHTINRTVYIPPGTSIVLENAGKDMCAYYRWYNYDTDAALADTEGSFSHANAGTYTTGSFGKYMMSNSSTAVSPGTTSYTLPSSGLSRIRIGCDVSNFIDFSTSNGVFTEPTLSCRFIYDIRDANEMADSLAKCTGNVFYEEYSLQAPYSSSTDGVRFGPQYRYANSTSNYYYKNSGTLTQITSGTWTYAKIKDADGNAISNPSTQTISIGSGGYSLKDSRLLQCDAISSKANAGTYEYKLSFTANGITYNIVKITVEYVPNTQIGPLIETSGKAIVTEDELKEDYILLAEQRFDFNDGVPYVQGDATTCLYGKPLPWDQISYGFVYIDNRHPNRGGSSGYNYWSDWSEYTLVRSAIDVGGASWLNHTSIENRTGAKNGYFVYIDAGVPSEKIADLSIDGHLCEGTSLFFSAYVADLNNASGSTRPNLMFVLTGYDEEGVAYELQKWTTGDIGLVNGSRVQQWQQVFYEMKIDGLNDGSGASRFATYTMRVYNNGESSSGNDFVFDDFQIFMNKPPTASMQMLSVCSGDERKTVVLEVDYLKWFEDNEEDIEAEGWTGDIFYRWEDAGENTMLMTTYWGFPGILSSFGEIDGLVYDPYGDGEGPFAAKCFTTRGQYFLENFTETDDMESDFFFLYTSGTLGEGRPMLCVVQRSLSFQTNQTYYSTVALSQADLSNYTCTSKTTIVIRDLASVQVDGGTGVSVDKLCTGTTYQAQMTFFITDDEGNKFEGYGLADWLYLDTDITEDRITEIKLLLRVFRANYPTATSFDQNLTSSYTEEVKSELMALANKFTLYERNLSFTINDFGETITYVAFPIEETIKLVSGSADEAPAFCPNPVRVEFDTSSLGGGGNEDVPVEISGKPRNVRVSKKEANSDESSFKLPVYFAKYDGSVYAQGNLFSLYETTDPSFEKGTDSFVYTFTVNGRTPQTVSVDGTNCYLLTSGDSLIMTTNSEFELKEGYEYRFRAQLGISDISEDDCEAKILDFNVLVVPTRVYWSPAEGSHAWNSDANWQMLENDTYRQGFVPKDYTQVIIPQKKVDGKANTTWPILPGVGDEFPHTTELGPQTLVTYDLYYQKRHCKEIYFEPHTILINQHNLVYEKAWVDMPFALNQFVWKSTPLQDMYLGDIYIPANGNETTLFPSEGYAAPNSRNTKFPFWGYFYNNTVRLQYQNSYGEFDAVKWSVPTNYLKAQGEGLGYGFRTWASAHNVDKGEVIVRLPKKETTYYYYNEDDQVTTVKEEKLSRTNAHKFSFNSDSLAVTINGYAKSNRFLVGNPFMAYIDADRFIEGNPHLDGTIYCIKAGTTKASTPDETNDPYEENIRALRNIGPMESFIVQLKNDATADKVKVLFASTMMSYVASKNTNQTSDEQIRSTSQTRSRNSALSRLYISAEAETSQEVGLSHASLVVKHSASDDYVSGEDVTLLSLDESYSPVEIFTSAGEKSLSINQINNMTGNTSIPLGIINKNSLAETVSCTFTGLNSFDRNIYLFDKTTNEYTLLYEGIRLELRIDNTDIRYYLTGSTMVGTGIELPEESVESNSLSVFVSGERTVTVYSTDPIRSLQVFNVLGRSIMSYNYLNESKYEITLPQNGIYILSATTNNGTYNRKIQID